MNKWIYALVILMTSLSAAPAYSQSDPWTWNLTIRTGNGSVVDQKTFTSRTAAEQYLWGLSPIHSTLRKVSSLGHPDNIYKFKYEAVKYKTEPGRRVFNAVDPINGPPPRLFSSYDAQAALEKSKEWFTKMETDRGHCPPIYENETWGETSSEVTIWYSYVRSLSARITILKAPSTGCAVDRVLENHLMVASHQICYFDSVQNEYGYYCNDPAPFKGIPQNPYRHDEINYDVNGLYTQLYIFSVLSAELEGRPNFCSPVRGNPCEISTGVKSETVADTVGYGNLDVVRHYTTAGGVRGSFGVDWAGPFDYRMDVDQGQSGYSFTSPGGRYIHFDYGLNGVWISRNNPDVTAEPFTASDSTIHILVKLSDKKIEFDSSGRPIKIQLDGSQDVILEYDVSSRLIRASSNGRILGFNYENDSFLVSTIIMPDSRLLDYTYLNDKLQSVNLEGAMLNTYEYDSTSGLLNKITLADGKYKTYQYDDKRRLIKSFFAGT